WLFLWVLLLLFLFGLVSGFGVIPSFLFYGELQKGNLLISAISFLAYYVNRHFLIRYLGDAARYFSGSPQHVKMRNDILQEGIDFIKHISDSGKYERIIIVGHSLGSVIAYDILKYLWADYNTVHGNPEIVNPEPLEALEKLVNDWPETTDEQMLAAYQKGQEDLWVQQRKHGNPWLITDFITLGSPLAHAPFLLSNSGAEFTIRKSDREFPTCPPILENGHFHFFNKAKDYLTEKGEKRSIYLLHHAALFGPTRWTNLYFPLDLIGGPLGPVFGKGIKDIEVGLAKKWLGKTPLSHTRYWDARPFSARSSELPENSSTVQLIKAMRLNSRKLLQKVKP
ncbi:MAG: hypothetical protein AAGD05_16515, partial [Bacteroidota bacterium]